MGESARTATFGLVALVLAAAAWAWAPAPAVPPVFDDQGTPFFPALTDPVGTPENPTVQSMEVVEYDAESATARVFAVQFRDGRWTIPSHHGYPADARERVAKTAAGVVGLRKDRIVTDRPADHAALGVVDPLAETAGALEGRGRRVTLKDGSGAVLAAFVVGLPVEGSPDMRYVRLPDQKRVYAVKMELDLSARFADWIETDLLRLGSWDLEEVVLDNYAVDEERGVLQPGETLTLRKSGTDGGWSLEGLADGESLDTAPVDTLVSTLDDLRIVGVRRKPPGLTLNLRSEGESAIDRASQVDLMRKGYFFTRDGGLFSNEGELRARTKNGVVVTLRFGEVLFGDEDDTGETAPATDGAAPAKAGAENRYLFVTAHFDESALERPTPPAETAPPAEGEPGAPTPPEEGDGHGRDDGHDHASGDEGTPSPSRDGAAQEEYERKVREFERLKEEGTKKARELTDRYADWYYVISADSFRKLHLSRSDLVKAGGE